MGGRAIVATMSHAWARVVGFVLFACGCSSENGATELPCVEAKLDCAPVVSPPTFDKLYANVFKPQCAAAGCHGAAVRGGLDMQTEDVAHRALAARAKAEPIGCSTLLKRIEAKDANLRMPPGSMPLSEPQLCAVRQWVANGAQR